MADVPHSGLTTTDLHEPKDVAGATANQVYVTDGAASGNMTDLHPKVAMIQYQETDGTGGEAYTTSWAAVNINTEVSDVDSIVTISAKAFTLGAGTYIFTGWVGTIITVKSSSGARARIRNTTDSTTICLSHSMGRDQSSVSGTLSANVPMSFVGTEVITGSKAYELQIISSTTDTLTGNDDAVTGGAEVYAAVLIEKVR